MIDWLTDWLIDWLIDWTDFHLSSKTRIFVTEAWTNNFFTLNVGKNRSISFWRTDARLSRWSVPVCKHKQNVLTVFICTFIKVTEFNGYSFMQWQICFGINAFLKITYQRAEHFLTFCITSWNIFRSRKAEVSYWPSIDTKATEELR